MNLQNELQAYAEKHGLSMSKIGHGQCENPFPVGRRNVYSAYLGKPISRATKAKLFEFFTNLNEPKNKQLANWIYYEDEFFYCSECIEKRLKEINSNKEFSEEIDYEGGETCSYIQDYAYQGAGENVECCKCGVALFSIDSDI